MRWVTAAFGITGLFLMGSVGFMPGGPATVPLESQILVFLAGVFLLALGGSGYAATMRLARSRAPSINRRG